MLRYLASLILPVALLAVCQQDGSLLTAGSHNEGVAGTSKLISGLAVHQPSNLQTFKPSNLYAQATPEPGAELREQAQALVDEAWVLIDKDGDEQEIIAKVKQALELYRRASDRQGEETTLYMLGVLQRRSDPDQAFENFRQSLELARELNSEADQQVILGGMANLEANRGNTQEAIGYYREAIDLARKRNDRTSLIDLLRGMGDAQYGAGKFQAAVGFYEEALDNAMLLHDAKAEAETRRDLAEAYLGIDEPGEAESQLSAALDYARQQRDQDLEAAVLESLAGVYRYRRQFDESLRYFEQALAIRRGLGDRPNEGRVLLGIGTIYNALGDLDQARSNYEQALELIKDTGDVAGQATLLNNLGAVYSSLGRFDEALENYNQAAEISGRAGFPVVRVRALTNIGQVYEEQRNYTEALKYYQEALAGARELDDSYAQSLVLTVIGEVYSNLGQYDKALSYPTEALEVARKAGNVEQEATALNNMGGAYSDTEQPEEALKYYSQALELRRKLGNWGLIAESLNNIGTTYIQLGRYPEALDYLQQSLALAREHEAGGYLEVALLANIGNVYSDHMHDYTTAFKYFSEAEAGAEKLHDDLALARVLNLTSMAHQDSGNLQEALKYLKRSIELRERVREKVRLEELKTGLSDVASDAYARGVLMLTELKAYGEAFDMAERARARGFLDQLGNARLDVRGGVDKELRDQETALRQEILALEQGIRAERLNPDPQGQTRRVDALATRLEAKQRDYQDLLVRLKLSNPEYASLTSVATLTLTETQQLLDDRTTLLSYFVTSEKVIAFVVTRTGFDAVTLDVGSEALAEEINYLRDFSDLKEKVPGSAKQLYAWLVAPLKERGLLHTRSIAVVPHGSLYYLPFAALSDGERFLADDYVLYTVPSASALKFIRESVEAGQQGAPAGPDALVLAQDRPEGLSPLVNAAAEARAIADLYKSKPVLGKDATEGEFRAEAGEHRYVHVAAHGALNAVTPLFSFLVLAPDPGAKDTSADGLLQVHEVYDLDLKKTELVVLSACQTQLGTQSAGDDVVGLNRAFIYAGAESVVASLWSVDDAATSRLMLSFYSHLAAGEGKAEALRSAQLETREQYPNPYYWASFVLTGDPGATREELGTGWIGSNPLPVAALVGAGVAALALAGFFILRVRRQRARKTEIRSQI
jgi:CHAT domain-containing protein/Tfp pilus assembly protein PilF